MEKKLINKRFYHQALRFFEDKLLIYEDMLNRIDSVSDPDAAEEIEKRMDAARESIVAYKNSFAPDSRRKRKTAKEDCPTEALGTREKQDKKDQK